MPLRREDVKQDTLLDVVNGRRMLLLLPKEALLPVARSLSLAMYMVRLQCAVPA